jgi:glycosyltransferase involved in cell wall biosynthesis
MQQHDYHVSFAVPDDGFVDDLKIMFPHVEIHIIPIVRNISPFNDLKALVSYLRLFNREQFDIIHLHTPKAGLLGSIAGRLLRHRHIVFHLHGLVSLKWDKLKPGLTLFMEKVPLKLAHKVLCVSQSLETLCIKNRIVSAEKITTLNHGSINGIDTIHRFNPTKLNEVSSKLKGELQAHDMFVLGFLGRMNGDKGLSDIVNVANQLSKRITNLLVVFVGPNEMDVDVDTYLSSNLTASFKYYPRTTTPELYISIFDVMLFPSYREGFGLVVAEANALEVPVVAYNIAGIQDAIADNQTGMLVQPGAINELVNAVSFYNDNPDTRMQHGINGRERVIKHFNPEELWKAQLSFYDGILKR